MSGSVFCVVNRMGGVRVLAFSGVESGFLSAGFVDVVRCSCCVMLVVKYPGMILWQDTNGFVEVFWYLSAVFVLREF